MSYQRDYERRMDVAVVGVGSHSYRNILPALHYLPAPAGVLRREPAAARKNREEYGCQAYGSTKELYASQKLDAVFIAVGPKLHPALAMEAFAAGVHVWLEKPWRCVRRTWPR